MSYKFEIVDCPQVVKINGLDFNVPEGGVIFMKTSNDEIVAAGSGWISGVGRGTHLYLYRNVGGELKGEWESDYLDYGSSLPILDAIDSY